MCTRILLHVAAVAALILVADYSLLVIKSGDLALMELQSAMLQGLLRAFVVVSLTMID
jgi:hypothetical protein